MGVSRIARGVFDPPIEFYRPPPPLAYLPLIVIWFGIDELSKVADLPRLFSPAGDERARRRALGGAGADPSRVFDGRVEMAGDPARDRPAAMPEILTAMRTPSASAGRRWSPRKCGRGHQGSQMVLNASNFLRTDIVIMGIVVIGAVAYLFDLLMRYIERVVVPWKGRV
jgi:taurine transport system permease protein